MKELSGGHGQHLQSLRWVLHMRPAAPGHCIYMLTSTGINMHCSKCPGLDSSLHDCMYKNHSPRMLNDQELTSVSKWSVVLAMCPLYGIYFTSRFRGNLWVDGSIRSLFVSSTIDVTLVATRTWNSAWWVSDRFRSKQNVNNGLRPESHGLFYWWRSHATGVFRSFASFRNYPLW